MKQKKVVSVDKEIPQFYFKAPCSDKFFEKKIRNEARNNFLTQRNITISNDSFQVMFNHLIKNQDLPKFRGCTMIDYISFMQVKHKQIPEIQMFFSANIFAHLHRLDDPKKRLSVDDFFTYVMKIHWMHQTRIGLALYDTDGNGIITESDFENYIFELIPTLTMLNSMDHSFQNFYVVTAVRKFFFFLDPQRTCKVKVETILNCDFLQDLLELREENMSLDAQQRNWFSAKKTLEVYGIYLSLDTNHNGMLSKDELSRYGGGRYTTAFIDRIFSELLTYNKEIDYKTYLDFVLAIENIETLQSLQFMFRILDIQRHNYLDVHDIHYFFRYIQEEVMKQNQEGIKFEDFQSELFDMVKPVHPYRITLNDLIKSGKGSLFVNILVDINSFFIYENRETASPPDNELEDELEDELGDEEEGQEEESDIDIQQQDANLM